MLSELDQYSDLDELDQYAMEDIEEVDEGPSPEDLSRALAREQKITRKTCSKCGVLPNVIYTCTTCNNPFCPNHIAPESHDCERKEAGQSK